MRLVLALTLLGAATAAAVACSAPSVDGSLIDGNTKLPTRDPGDDDDDTTDAAPATSSTTPTVTAPPPDAGITVTPSKACTITNTSLCFTFEGSATDLSSDGFQPTVVTGLTYVAGHENEAAQFTATSALQFPANPVLELPAGAATIEAWIKRQDTGGDAAVFDDDGRFSLTVQRDGTMICKSSGGVVASTATVPTDTWVHLACVVDGATITAYMNGQPQGHAAGSVASAPTKTASIGANAPPGSAEGDQVFVGLIDSFRLLNVARAATDIAADAAGP